MGERKHSSKAFLPITKRIRAAIAQTVDAEQAQATKEGMPKSVFLTGAMNTLMWISCRTACRLIAPEEDPGSDEGRARVKRVQRALADALFISMRHEREEWGAPGGPSWPGAREGHA